MKIYGKILVFALFCMLICLGSDTQNPDKNILPPIEHETTDKTGRVGESETGRRITD